MSTEKPPPEVREKRSKWPVWRCLLAWNAGLSTMFLAGSLKQELLGMPLWVRPIDAAMFFAAGYLFFIAGTGLIRHRKLAGEVFASMPGGSFLCGKDPVRTQAGHTVCFGVVMVVFGCAMFFGTFNVLFNSK